MVVKVYQISSRWLRVVRSTGCFCKQYFFSAISTHSIDNKILLYQCTELSERDVDDFFKRNTSMQHVKPERVRETVDLLRSLPVNSNEILQNPQIFSLPFVTVRKRYDILKDLGFPKIGLKELLWYKWLVQMNLKTLQKAGYFEELKMADWLSRLVLPQQVMDKMRKEMAGLEAARLQEIHTVLVTQCISWLLKIAEKDAASLVRKYALTRLSVHSIMKTWDLLTTKLNFYPEKIKSNPFLLSLTCDRLTPILRDVATLGSVPIKDLAHACPRLLCKHPQDLIKNWNWLDRYKITSLQLRTFPTVLLLSPKTLQHRLRVMFQSPQMENLRHNVSFLRLVYQYVAVQKRLVNAKPDESLTVDRLCSADTLRRNADWRKVAVVLSYRLGVPQSLIKTCLKRHPRYSEARLVNALGVLDILKNSGYSSTQILNGLALILHDSNVVAGKLVETENEPELQPFYMWKKRDNVLQFVLYFAEQEKNFADELISNFM